MITSLHTFGRDLKWNPHIHALVLETYYSPSSEVKTKNHFDYKNLEKHFNTSYLDYFVNN